MARLALPRSLLKGDPEGRLGVNNQIVGGNVITFLSAFSLYPLSSSVTFSLSSSPSSFPLYLRHLPFFPCSHLFRERRERPACSRLLCCSSLSFIIALWCVCLPHDARRVAGPPPPCVGQQGAAGSAGPRGEWPGRARVRHNSGGGRLVSAWPKSKEDVCRASPCSPSLPTSLTLTRAPGLCWRGTNNRTLLASLRLWLAVAPLKRILKCIKINRSASCK